MNPELDELYRQLLHHGLLMLREACDTSDREWIASLIELLHNVPSLIGDKNASRHGYFWHQERPGYIEWAKSHSNERAKSTLRTYYEPIWRQMEPLLRPPSA